MNASTNKQHPDQQELIEDLLSKLCELQRRVHEGTIDPLTRKYERIRVAMELCLEQLSKRDGRPGHRGGNRS